MSESFWFNRMVEYWSLPTHLDIPALARRAKLQVVQAGTFGPQFYGLADDPEVERYWAGMPLVGVRENLDYAAGVIAGVHEAGTRFVGQMSMSWHYGDHEKKKGLFDSWERIWSADLLGEAPCRDPGEMMEQVAGGELRCWPIEGRPYRTYSGCFCNPHWLAMLKAMARKAITLGVDGLMVHHNFSSFCRCGHCRAHLMPRLREIFAAAELCEIFGTAALEEVDNLLSPGAGCPAGLKQRFSLAFNRLVHQGSKEAFDEIFVGFGRGLKPDLLLAQWYHKYDFQPHDERSLLPAESWGRDESYIWYSQGGHKGMSRLERGYLADMGLPARFILAAGGGRPFVVNKYDARRLRLSIAEAATHGAASLAFHQPQMYLGDAELSKEEYFAPVVRYHRFIGDRQELYHPARPWSQVALVYPRRAELEAEGDCLEPLKRLGKVLEDGHWLFDIVLEEQLVERGGEYAGLILPGVERLSAAEGTWLRSFVERGGRLVLAGENGTLDLAGKPHAQPLLANGLEEVEERLLRLPEGLWAAEEREVLDGVRLRVYPPLVEDAFGQGFLGDLENLLGGSWLRTDAPWFVRVRAWRPEGERVLVLHWVNYQQDEDSLIEVPRPVGPVQVECAAPAGERIARVEWLYPEMRQGTTLPHEVWGGGVRFVIPSLIVYGLSVLHLEKS